MSVPESRLRPPPAERFAGPEHRLDIGEALTALRSERHPPVNGHRQITLFHHGPVRLVLFAFDAGGRLPEHRAPGFVTIHVLRGSLLVRTPRQAYELAAGQVLALDPDIPHDVEAGEESDMLLGIYPEAPLPGTPVVKDGLRR
jgi:quercetin dioxygenase-like cupin family protein